MPSEKTSSVTSQQSIVITLAVMFLGPFLWSDYRRAFSEVPQRPFDWPDLMAEVCLCHCIICGVICCWAMLKEYHG